MLNVLQISTFFTEHGGVEKSVADLSYGLASKQHNVRVLCTVHGRGNTDRINGVQVESVGSVLTLAGRPLSCFFPKALSNQYADVAHYHLPCPIAVFSAPVARPRATVQVATWHHDLVRHKLFNKTMQPFMERFLRELDAIFVTAPALIESTPILQRFRNKCRVVPLGIAHERFSTLDHNGVLDAREKFGAPLILYVGRLVYYKGCEVLINAIKDVPGANLIMVGSGPLEPKLRQLIHEQNLQHRVHLLGRQSDDSLRTLFQACDFFVLPSTLPTECFGLVQVEAMLCGKPVINTDLPTGVPWVSVHEETGLTVQPSDPVALARAIRTLMDKPEFRKELGVRARIRAQEMFTLDKHLANSLWHYEELLAKKISKQPATVR